MRRPLTQLGVVHAERDRRRDDAGGEPGGGQGDEHALRVGPMLHVPQRSCDGDETKRDEQHRRSLKSSRHSAVQVYR